MDRPLSLTLKDEAEKAKSRERKDFYLDCFLEADRLECVVKAQGKQIRELEAERARLVELAESFGLEVQGATIRHIKGIKPIIVEQPNE